MSDALLAPWLDGGTTFQVSLAASDVVFLVLRNWLKELRGGKAMRNLPSGLGRKVS
jgi:hypothetical protein